MKNKEKHAEQIVDIACNGDSIAVVRSTGELGPCCETSCRECLFNTGTSSCKDETRKWADSEYVERPVISKSDRTFLDYIGNTYKYVVRDRNGKLFVCKKVYAINDEWFSSGCVAGSDYTYISGFDVQFPMVKVISSTAWSIKDLKKLEVVDEYWEA